jgi:hypothetical protein
MQSALQNQQTGVAAGSALGNVGNQLVQSALNTGTFQQNAPYASALNLANVVGKLQAPKTTTTTKDLGFLNQLGALGSMVTGGINALSGDYVMDPKTGKVSKRPGILDQIGVKGGLPGLYSKVTGLFSSKDEPNVGADAGAYNPDTGMTDYIGADGNQVSIDASGNYYDEAGNMIWSPSWGESTDESYEEDNMNGGDSGGGGLEDESGYYDDYTGEYVPETYESNYGSGYDD